ncbi:MAG: TIGR03905 family TSCPD domain-containing protein, partial [Roseburia sp.]|nr:TIGR03905 family TSCPD domain-containing protein [Roseburia sp.]
HGNLQAIPRLVEGMTVEEVERRISGIRCGMKNTSCGDQLAKALREAYEAQKNDK